MAAYRTNSRRVLMSFNATSYARPPVILENGQTFDKEAIVKWLKECRSSGRKPVSGTLRELRITELNPSIALRNTIEQWNARNEAVQLDISSKLHVVLGHSGEGFEGCFPDQNRCKRALTHLDGIPNFYGVFPSIL